MLENVSNSFEHVKVPLGYSVTAEWIVFVVDDFKYEMNLFFGKSFQTHITNENMVALFENIWLKWDRYTNESFRFSSI